MKARELGNSGLTVSPIGLGLAALGRPGYINLGHASDLRSDYNVAAMEERTHAVLDTAWKAGIRYFDAARSYGRAEQFLGSWLRTRSGITCTVGSKWGYTYTADWQIEAAAHEKKDHSLPVLTRQIAETREHLGNHLSLYQIHSATAESAVLENAAVLRGLADLKSAGLRIGLSVSGPQQSDIIQQAIGVTVDGSRLFDTVQATWNLLEQSAGPALQEASDAGMGVIVKEGLANGRLTDRNNDPAFSDKRRLLMKATSQLNASPDQFALAAALAQPWTGIVLSGAATAEHLQSNIAALEIPWTDEQHALLPAFAESSTAYWATRSGLRWN
jgi:aryl-alcohol dehydrogenase-like predicted oxidoreductase